LNIYNTAFPFNFLARSVGVGYDGRGVLAQERSIRDPGLDQQNYPLPHTATPFSFLIYAHFVNFWFEINVEMHVDNLRVFG